MNQRARTWIIPLEPVTPPHPDRLTGHRAIVRFATDLQSSCLLRVWLVGPSAVPAPTPPTPVDPITAQFSLRAEATPIIQPPEYHRPNNFAYPPPGTDQTLPPLFMPSAFCHWARSSEPTGCQRRDVGRGRADAIVRGGTSGGICRTYDLYSLAPNVGLSKTSCKIQGSM